MNNEYIRRFQRDYRRAGKYDLDIQVEHLARLADDYQCRYEESQDWTDCLRAHTLFNSCGVRRPSSEGWSERTFQIQQLFWNGCSDVTYEQQVELNQRLRSELDSIRNESRAALVTTNKLAIGFKVEEDCRPDFMTDFVSSVRETSLLCTERMVALSRTIIAESVKLLTQDVPCGFSAVAIGSLARGEATPYSDLEYLFLTENNSEEVVEYFERLAVTSYFLIGNLRETKLSYMAIDELHRWFDDRAINGFKIDGLSKDAGNIPTGNGSPQTKNLFITTPQELAEKYRHTLQNPDEKLAMRGDLTAMLTYMEPVYTSGESGRNLVEEFKLKVSQIELSEKRLAVNRGMFRNDMEKFDFIPDSKLQDRGFNVDVKRQIYRFPSLLLFDLSILWNVHGANAWETVKIMLQTERITEEFYHKLTFMLACACFIRLSAYLYHDSHDDRVSVAPHTSEKIISDTESPKAAHSRWFVPLGLFSKLCDIMIPLKSEMMSVQWPEAIEHLPFDDTSGRSSHLDRVQTLFSCGRYTDARHLLLTHYGDQLVSEPKKFIEYIQGAEGQWLDSLRMIVDILCKCCDFNAALEYSIVVNCVDSSLQSVKWMADCHQGLSQFKQAFTILESSGLTSGDIDIRLGVLCQSLDRQDAAEAYFLSALEKYCNEASTEEVFDYYGNLVYKTALQSGIQPSNSIATMSPLNRLHHLPNATVNIAETISSLQYFYYCQGQYQIAEQYNTKYKELLSELYGEGALVIGAVGALCKTGNALSRLNQAVKAEDCFLKSLALCREIYGEHSNHTDIAILLGNLGYCYNGMEQHGMAEKYFMSSLNMLRMIFGENAQHIHIAEQLRELGGCYTETQQFEKAFQVYEESLAIYISVYGDHSDSSDIAYVLRCQGRSMSCAKDHDKALKCYNESLAIYNSLCDEQSEGRSLNVSLVLNDIAHGHYAMRKHEKAADYYQKSLDMYKSLHGSETDHLNIAIVLVSQGDNFKIMREFNKAVDCYQRSLAMYQAIYEAESNQKGLATVFRNLGSKYNDMKEYSRANQFFNEALALFSEVYASRINHENIASVLKSMGSNYHDMGEYDAAQAYYTLTLNMYRELSEVESDLLGIPSTLNCLGLNCTESRQFDQSLVYLKESLSLYENFYGKTANNENIAVVLNNYAYNYNHMGKYKKAAEYFKKCVTMREKLYANYGDCDSLDNLADVIYNQGYNYVDLKKYKKAEECYLRCLDMYRIIHGQEADHLDITKVLGDLGANCTEWGKLEKAEAYYYEALAMYKRICGEECYHPGAALLLFNLHQTHVRQGDEARARLRAQESLDLFLIVDPDNPTVTDLHNYLFSDNSGCVVA